MYKINIGSNHPDKFKLESLLEAITQNAVIVTDPKETDFFLFPVFYEVLFEYNEYEYSRDSITEEDIANLRVLFKNMVDNAGRYKKKILIFYYRDPVKKIEIANAIVFRTSLLKSKSQNEYGFPAYLDDVTDQRTLTNSEALLPKSTMPTVGFRGQAAAINLPVKLSLKRKLNGFFDTLGIEKTIELHYNFGYLARRDAIVSCLNNKQIKADITITNLQPSIDSAIAKKLFLNNLFGNQYNICASGHGNYSFRLYETLCAARIPVFINTDCALPFEEFIDWKKHVVWVEEKEAHKAAKFILDFHQAIHPDDFLQLQQNNRLLWEQYLCFKGFFENLYRYFNRIDSNNQIL